MLNSTDSAVYFENILFYYKRRFFSKYTADDTHLYIEKFQIRYGESVGIIGKNGAGKSTMLKLILGILKPYSGKIKVLNQDVWKKRCLLMNNIGVVWGNRSTLWWDLSAKNNLYAMKKIYSIPINEFRQRYEQLTEIFKCSSFLDRNVRLLSLGQRMKVEIISALLHNPKLLILDEAFIGLDKQTHRNFITYLKQKIKNDKTTCIFTSHNFKDVKTLASNTFLLEN